MTRSTMTSRPAPRLRKHMSKAVRAWRLLRKIVKVSEINHAHWIKAECRLGSQRCNQCPDIVCSDNMIMHEIKILVGK